MKKLILLFAIFYCVPLLAQDNKTVIDRLLSERHVMLYQIEDAYASCKDTVEINKLFNELQFKLESSDQKNLNVMAFAKAISKRGNHAEASKMLSRIYGSAMKGSSEVKGEYFGALGSITYNSEEPEQAKKYLQKSLHYLNVKDYTLQRQAKLINLGMVCNALQDFDEAINYFARAEDLNAHSIPKFKLYLILNRAITWSNTGKEELAKNEFRAAMKLFEEAPDPFAEIRTLGNIGDILLKQDSLKDALDHYTVALQRSEQEGFDMGRVIYHEMIAECATKLGDYKMAYEHLLAFQKSRESMELAETKSILSQLEIQHQANLEKASRLNQEQIARTESEKNAILLVSIALLAVLSVFLAIKIFTVRRQNRILLERNLSETRDQQMKKVVPAHPDAHEEIIRKLEEYVIGLRHFEQSQLTLDKLSRKLNTNRTYLSEAINAHFGKNFSKWINEVRVKEARILLLSPKHAHYSIEGIANLAGFSSVSTFNSNFKAITGLTPSYFRKNGLTS